MTELDELVKRLRELEAKATPGPWRAGHTDTDCIFGDVGRADLMAPELGRVIARTNLHFAGFDRDARLIAETRNALPDILKALEEYRQLVGALDYLGCCSGTALVTPKYRADIDPENCIEAARELGWKPEASE